MFANYLKTAFRALWRRKFISGLSIAGLALGMAAFLFLLEFASFHAGFDANHANGDRLYRLVGLSKLGPMTNVSPMMLALRDRFPAIEAVPTFMTSAGGVVTYKPQNNSQSNSQGNSQGIALDASQTRVFKEEEVAYANNEVFQTFTLPLLAGIADLDKPNTMVIDATTAQKYFSCGENFQSVIGKILSVANQFAPQDFTITGVMRDMPEQSHLRGNMFFSLQTLANPAVIGGNSWAELSPNNGSGFLTAYILLKQGSNPKETETMMNNLPGSEEKWYLQPIRSVHTGDGFNDPLPNQNALRYVVVASSIALFVLALAWINYINLSTAFGLSRAREIGVRKTLGASRLQLVTPHLLECALLAVAAFLLALVGVELFQKPFNSMLGTKLTLGNAFSFGIAGYGLVALVLGAVLSGSYVALVLTGVNPVVVLKGNFARSKSGGRIRSTLVVVQFAVSIAFIAGTFIVLQQMSFMRNRDLGMKLEQLIVIDGPEVLDDETPGAEKNMENAFAFKQEASRLPFVKDFAGSQNIPGEWYNFSTEGIKRPTGQKDDAKRRYNMLLTDENFFHTYGMTFAAGEGYKNTDNLGNFRFRKVVMNEAAVLQLGFKSSSEAIGQYVQWGDDNKGQRFQVGGVIKNYHHKSLKDPIEPIVFLPSEATRCFTLRIATDNVQANIAALEQLYKKILPGNPFIARFADDIFQKQYENETRIANVFTLFGTLALIIACLGLFGLAAFAAESRTKEIGVRKVLGASEASIIGLLSKDFLKLVGIAFVIGIPFAFWLMNAWLQDFAYHLDLRSGFSIVLFALAGIIAAGVAFLTVAGQAWKAARANAIDSLRYE